LTGSVHGAYFEGTRAALELIANQGNFTPTGMRFEPSF
jgi:hypothetical protein